MNRSGKKILIVEDEVKIVDLLSDYLTSAGYRTKALYTGARVVDSVSMDLPDLILLDLMLPDMDGLNVLKQVRDQFNLPVIIITARTREEDVLFGLGQGADDYICKPFSPREVVARVRTVLRRSPASYTRQRICIGSVCLDSEARDVSINGKSIALTQNEFIILKMMMQKPGKVVSRQEMLKKLQGTEPGEDNRVIDTHVKNLRKKMVKALPEESVVLSVYGMGYKFNPDLGNFVS